MSSAIAQHLWATHIALHITHPSHPTTPFITSLPRFSYLALLLPRLSAFFNSPCSSFYFEDVQLRNLAVGLLADLYRPSPTTTTTTTSTSRHRQRHHRHTSASSSHPHPHTTASTSTSTHTPRHTHALTPPTTTSPRSHAETTTTTTAAAAAAATTLSNPWRLVVTDGVSWDIADTFLNSVKEADFIRNGNANQIMKMSKEHTTQLWHAVIDNDFAAYSRVHTRLLDAPTALKHVPVRVYIPSSSSSSSPSSSNSNSNSNFNPSSSTSDSSGSEPSGAFRVVQTLIPAAHRSRGAAQTSGGERGRGAGGGGGGGGGGPGGGGGEEGPGAGAGAEPMLLGEALKLAMPSLFPRSRGPVLANVLLHGVPAPFDAPLEELMREAAYPDGWLCFVVVVI